MADERSQPPWSQPSPIAKGYDWPSLPANPPFSKKSSTMITGAEGRGSTEKDVIERDDFWATAGGDRTRNCR